MPEKQQNIRLLPKMFDKTNEKSYALNVNKKKENTQKHYKGA